MQLITTSLHKFVSPTLPYSTYYINSVIEFTLKGTHKYLVAATLFKKTYFLYPSVCI